MSTAAERATGKIYAEIMMAMKLGKTVDVLAIIKEEFAPIIEQRDKAWLLAEHREKNVERERKLEEVAKALKDALIETLTVIENEAGYGEAPYGAIAALKQAKEAGL